MLAVVCLSIVLSVCLILFIMCSCSASVARSTLRNSRILRQLLKKKSWGGGGGGKGGIPGGSQVGGTI
jgi:hypothetical protein